jgi:hypothetical protein
MQEVQDFSSELEGSRLELHAASDTEGTGLQTASLGRRGRVHTCLLGRS